jgi:hypothetical protein
MVKPYTAVGLIPTVRGIRRRADIQVNLEHVSTVIKAAAWLSSLELPVRLIALPEGALQGFNDEVLDLDHVQSRANVPSIFRAMKPPRSGSWRASMTSLSWRRPKHAIPTGRIASLMWALS